MGLRHRTPMSALREQRRCAELAKRKSDADVKLSRPTSKSSSNAGPTNRSQINRSDSAAPFERLLSRLRRNLDPQWPHDMSSHDDAGEDCASLQDELQRIAERKQKSQEGWPDELSVPLEWPRTQNEAAPGIRTVKVCLGEPIESSMTIAKLSRAPSSLSRYSCPPPTKAVIPQTGRPSLSLVVAEPKSLQSEPESHDSPSEEQAIGEETAGLMSSYLEKPLQHGQQAKLPHQVALSLLDD